jgi:hypothetical protein
MNDIEKALTVLRDIDEPTGRRAYASWLARRGIKSSNKPNRHTRRKEVAEIRAEVGARTNVPRHLRVRWLVALATLGQTIRSFVFGHESLRSSPETVE